MGKTRNSGIAHGTSGSPQETIEQGNLISKVKEIERKQMIQPLIVAGVKFNEKDVLFVTKDQSGQMVWLEKGNDNAGLNHILYGNNKEMGHKKDFEKACGITEDKVPTFLRDVMTKGRIISNELKIMGTKQGFERVYAYNGQYVVVTGIGTNGFIVSAYPRRK